MQDVGVAAERAFLDQVAIEGGQVEVRLVVFGIDVAFVRAVVKAGGGERGAVLIESDQFGPVSTFLCPAAVGTGKANVDCAVRGRHPPANVLQPLQGAQELGTEPRCRLLVGVGLHRVVGVGDLGQRVEELDIVGVDQFGDLVFAQCVDVGLLVGVVRLGVEYDFVRGIVQCPEAHHRVGGELAAGGLGQ